MADLRDHIYLARPSAHIYHCDYEPTEGPCTYTVAESLEDEGEAVQCGELGWRWINFKGWRCEFHGEIERCTNISPKPHENEKPSWLNAKSAT